MSCVTWNHSKILEVIKRFRRRSLDRRTSPIWGWMKIIGTDWQTDGRTNGNTLKMAKVWIGEKVFWRAYTYLYSGSCDLERNNLKFFFMGHGVSSSNLHIHLLLEWERKYFLFFESNNYLLVFSLWCQMTYYSMPLERGACHGGLALNSSEGDIQNSPYIVVSFGIKCQFNSC